MEVTRIFHPVGQGGFYTESFDDQIHSFPKIPNNKLMRYLYLIYIMIILMG